MKPRSAGHLHVGGNQLSPAHVVLTFSLIGVTLCAEAGIPFMSETVSWDEDVLQSDGQVLSVGRTATYGPDEWGRSGRGRLKAQTIRFSHKGKKIKWENDDNWPIHYMPDILDVVDGMPVLVMPVHRWGPCNKYDFPQEGLVAFVYRNGDWSRIPIGDLSKDLKVNLMRSTHAIRHWDEYKGKRITPSDKVKLENSGGWGSTKQNQTIPEASKFYAAYEDSCARIRPLPNPPLEVSKQTNAEAEANAQVLIATVKSSSKSFETVSSDDFRKAKGEWTGTGYLGESCKGIVERIEPLRQYRDGGAWSLVGYTLILKNGSHIPIQQPSIKWAQAPDSLEAVVCNLRHIFAVKRQSKDQLIVHRFLQSGTVADALRITLPNVSQSFSDGQWPMIWEVLAAEDQLTIVLAIYTYQSTANLGGLLGQRVQYTTALPK